MNNLNSYYEKNERLEIKLKSRFSNEFDLKLAIESTAQIRNVISEIVKGYLSFASINYPQAVRLSWQEESERNNFWSDLINRRRWSNGYYWHSSFAWKLKVSKINTNRHISTYLTVDGQILHVDHQWIEGGTIDDHSTFITRIDYSKKPKLFINSNILKSVCWELIDGAEEFGIDEVTISAWKKKVKGIV